MDIAAAYVRTREELIDQASTLDSASASAPVPATPGWTVKDVYSHLTGVASDSLGGVLDGAGTPPWTARQVAARADRSLEQVCEEWASLEVAEWLANVGPRGSFAAFDAWTHQQDIRGALGRSGARDERLDFLVTLALDVFDRRLREASAPPVRIHGECVDRVIGGEDPAVELRAGDYEVMRLLFGRRSMRQVEVLSWSGDWRSCIDHLHLFDLASVNLID